MADHPIVIHTIRLSFEQSVFTRKSTEQYITPRLVKHTTLLVHKGNSGVGVTELTGLGCGCST